MTSTTYLRAATAASLAVLAVTAIAATRPATTVAGQATLDRARAAELTFPYPHLSILRLTGDGQPDEARLIFDDGTVTVGTQVSYQVPTTGEPFQVATNDQREAAPSCDDADHICWGKTTVGPWLNASIEVTYLDLPCVITGSPVDRTTINCTDAAAG